MYTVVRVYDTASKGSKRFGNILDEFSVYLCFCHFCNDLIFFEDSNVVIFRTNKKLWKQNAKNMHTVS